MKTLRLFATLRDIAGKKEIEVPFEDGQTVYQLIESIKQTCPELGDQIIDADGKFTGAVHILVDGRHVHWKEDGLNSLIREKDQVVLLPPVAGG